MRLHHDDGSAESYNEADIISFIEAVDKTRRQYYPGEIDMLKDVVSIPGISMTYVLNKSRKMTAQHHMPQTNLMFLNVRSAR